MPRRPVSQSYALTVLSPILGGHTHGAVHAARIRAVLARLPQGADSPLAAIGTLHLARLVVIDDLRNQGIPAREDHLRSKYLFFAADFDGARDDFLRALAERATTFVQEIWSNCIGFPGADDPAAFVRYIGRCEVPTTFPFGAYLDAPLPRVLTSLDTQRRLIGFLREHQGAPAAALQAAFAEFATELRRADVPAPGTI